ncbi:50S ribosomal protein L15 [candidate division GN15 bacterium]|uniref:Large ribosomal subunit protein uL15 n=1 Tax=candidate division GN15 bacterium TaxID=2072418 RepID=A0A855X757_9BACT|nr:MAG: 50S ribosomal protein L15 [candidate division GN15 bacterium]
MKLHTLKPPQGSRTNRKRVGRGAGSGMGETSTRGHKGAKARSGYKHKRGFEGGQMPLHRRLPKIGFTNIFKQDYQVINLKDLARMDSGEITVDSLKAAGIIRSSRLPVKVLGGGAIDKPYTVKAAAFSKSAVSKIEAAGGKAEVTK